MLVALGSIIAFFALGLVLFDFLFRRTTRYQIGAEGVSYFTFGRFVGQIPLNEIADIEVGSYLEALLDSELRGWHRRNWTHKLLSWQEVRLRSHTGHIYILTPDNPEGFVVALNGLRNSPRSIPAASAEGSGDARSRLSPGSDGVPELGHRADSEVVPRNDTAR